MADNLKKLKTLTFVLNIAGLHFDLDTKKSGYLRYFLLSYCILVNLITLIAFGEELYIVIVKEMPFFFAFFLTFCSMCYFWCWVKGTYLLVYRAEVTRVFSEWRNLSSGLWPELREDLLHKKLAGVMKSTKIMFGVAVAPYSLVVASKIYTSTVFVPTAFMEDYLAKEGPADVVIYQCVSVVLLNTTLVAYEAFLILMVKLLLVELEYLNVALERILQQISHTPSSVEGGNMCLIRKQLVKWLNYHGSVISRNVKHLFSPLVVGQYIFLIVIMCGLLYCSASGRLPLENTGYCYVTAIGFTFLTFLSCRQGDKVEEKGMLLAGKEMPSTWILLPSDVKKALLTVQRVAQKPLTINIAGHVPLNSKTFHEMLLMQYRFYRFMADMQ